MSVLLGFLQIIMFIVSISIGGVVPLKQNFMIGPHVRALVLLGAKQGYLIQHGQMWRFLTPILLHGGLLHLLLNMLCQWRFALYIERRWGTLKFAAVYVGAGFGASLLSCLWSPDRIGVGASGSLMGVIGGFLADLLLNWHNTEPNRRKAVLIQVAVWSGLGLILGLVPGVDGGAHLGGWFVGFCAGFVVNSHIPKEKRNRILAMAIPAALIGIFLLVGTICFFTVVKPTVFKTSYLSSQ
jgi:membrane associated rhomboid family serine protease